MLIRRRLLAVAIGAGLFGPSSHAATITVNSASDDPAIIGINECRLRTAVSAANSDSALLGCAAGNGADLIVFDSSLRSTITLEQGQIEITSSMTIDGGPNRGGITVSGSNASKIFAIAGALGTIDVTLQRLNLIDGRATSCGAVYSSENLTVIDSTLTGNLANGAGIGGGGAICNHSNVSTLTLTGSTVSGNTSTGAVAGGILTYGPLAISNSTIDQNSATGDGGGIGVGTTSATITISGSTITNNRAGDNGGSISTFADLTIDTSVLEGNSAGGTGGAIQFYANGATLSLSQTSLSFNQSDLRGGAINARDTTVIEDSTLVGNTSGQCGGAVYVFDPHAPYDSTLTISDSVFDSNSTGAICTHQDTTITNSTVSNSSGQAGITAVDRTTTLINSTVSSNLGSGLDVSSAVVTNSAIVNNSPQGIDYAGELELRNTVIAGSASVDCDDDVTLTVNVNNLVEDGSCSALGVNFLSGDPLLGPLQDNGGTTLTHAPLPGSPLVDAGDNGACPTADQTGMPRPIDGNADGDEDCDIGAVEHVDLFPPIAQLGLAPDVTSAGASSFEIAVTYNEGDGAIALGSPGTTDITITPGPLSIQSVALSGSPGQLTVTYTVTPPGGSWDAADSGVYSIEMNPDEVFDTAITGANAVVAGTLGEFTVTIAEIDVTGNGVSIATGDVTPSTTDDTDFGDVSTGGSATRTFTISNQGAGEIELTGAVSVIGQGFSTTQPAATVLGAGESTQIDVSFAPTAVGLVSGLVTIPNDDDDENPYTFAVNGNGVDGPVGGQLIFEDGFEN